MAGKFFRFVGAYFRVNMAAALEYRASLVTQVLGMMLNDVLWVIFWVLYFTRFPVLRGWTLDDVLVMWASVALSIGLVEGFAPNSMRLPRLVAQGQLDYYLALPKDVLLHLLLSEFRLYALGDVIFGPVLLVVMVKLTWVKVAVYLATALLAAVVLLGFFIMVGSLAFFVGNSEGISAQFGMAILHFATYPTTIFDSGVKFILFTLVPAGFVSTLPVELVREFHWLGFGQLLGAAVLFLGLAVWVFRVGLRRYESGSLMMMRG